MGTRENIIECMYKGPLVILFHVYLMMFWTLNMFLFLAFNMELHFLAIQLGLLHPFVFHFAIYFPLVDNLWQVYIHGGFTLLYITIKVKKNSTYCSPLVVT
jgi:hypothetical protein